jgi:hypothetical protein
MSKYLNRAREYHDAIKQILMNEWDPIGVRDILEAQDEYDSYVPDIHGLLIHHESEEKLLEHLWLIETDYMGLCGNRHKTENVAKLLIELRERMEKNF